MNAFERATSGYDPAHERALTDAIIKTVIEASLIGEPSVLALRLGEIAHALTNVLVLALAMSPGATRSPTAIRHMAEEFRRRLTKRAAEAARDPTLNDFVVRAFRSDDRERGGNA